MKGLVAASALLCLSGCNKPTPEAAPLPAIQNPARESRNDFQWERRRQCAAGAEDVMKRPDWKTQNGISVTGWSNHYNVATDRCYVQVNMYSHGEKTPGTPSAMYQVFDVFDAGISIACTDRADANTIFCAIEEPGTETLFDCARCRSRATDLMSK